MFACNFIFVFVGNIAFVFVDNFVFVFVGNFLPLLSSTRHHKDWDEAHLILVTTITTAGCVKNSVKYKNFQWVRVTKSFDVIQKVLFYKKDVVLH